MPAGGPLVQRLEPTEEVATGLAQAIPVAEIATTFGAKAELDDAQLRSLGAGTANDPCWREPSDAAVIAAVDALHHDNDLDDATWSGLVETVGTDVALEITLLAGWYHAISYAVRAFRPNPGPAPSPGDRPGKDSVPEGRPSAPRSAGW